MWSLTCYASPKGTVNILTRRLYLRSPEIISAVKNECGVEISYDEYYSCYECLRRSATVADFYHYDIVIFPNNIYTLIKSKIKLGKSDLSKVVHEYSEDVRKHYVAGHYPHNVVYFALSLSGFVWDSAVIQLSTGDSIVEMFEKAKNNIVVLNNSRPGLWNLIDNERKVSPQLIAQVFGKVVQNADIYIADGYNELYNQKEFAFAFQRSGEAVSIIKATKNKTLDFIMHPIYSYVSPDMMAELNARPETRCVARVLASKKILDVVQEKNYYLSPYGTYRSVKDPIFHKVYRQLFDRTYHMRWLDASFFKNVRGFAELKDVWDKIYLLPKVVKNYSDTLRRDLEPL